jgi:hypothetical protein
VHRGTVEARALFFEVALIGEDAARRRVLENWSPGAQVYEVADGYLLRLAVARYVICNTAPGCPLTEEKALLLSAPLTEAERRALEITGEALVLVRGGAVQVFPLAECKPVDIAMWLDVGFFETASLQSLGEAPSAPPLLVTESSFDVREKLGVQIAPELEKLMAQMQSAPQEKQEKESFFLRWMATLGTWWQSLTMPRGKVATSTSSLPPSNPAGSLITRKTSLWVGLLVMAVTALVVMALASSSLPPVDFTTLVFTVVTGLMLYGLMWFLWLFLAGLFARTSGLTSSSSWLKRLPWIVGIAALLLFFATGHSFNELSALLSKLLWLLLVFLSVVLGGVLLIAALVWGARQIEAALKAHNEATVKPKTPGPTPLAGDVPLSWTIGGAALGVLIAALRNNDFRTALIAATVLLAALIYSLFDLKKQRAKRSSGKGTTTRTDSPTPARAATSLMPPEPVQGPFAGLRNALARAAWMAGLWRIYGPIQARYVARLMDMFARGDLDNALRHAIPMGGAMGNAGPAFGVPRTRSLLEIFTGRQSGGSILPMPLDIAEQLRQQYRAAFERLQAQGRHEEAAFVLAELLHASEEAVAYLERQKRFRLAAELAEGRDLPADLVVRQWLVAGDGERALWIARRRNAFYSAIARLEKGSASDQTNAQKLRLLWANELARSGDYVAAVSAAWPVVEARHLIGEWMKRGLLTGGLGKARMLAWRCQIATTMEAELREMVLELLNDSLPEAPAMRLEFAQRLAGDSTKSALPVVRTLARATTRALVRDAASDSFNETRKKVCQQLIEVAGDGALRADVPSRLFVSSGQPLKEREQPLEIVIEAEDSGALPLYDAAFLPDGRTIVALGEDGARLLSRDGRAIMHFDQPCHRLVLSDLGDRALALAPRGEAMRLARLDFASRRAVSWCETRLDVCAFDYDGSLWFVAAQGSLFAIDATASKFGALWHTPEVGQVACIERSPTSCSFLTRFLLPEPLGFLGQKTREKWERWQLEVPSLTLRQRTVIGDWGGVMEETGPDISAKAVTPDGIRSCLNGGGMEPVMLMPQGVKLSEHQGETVYSLQGTAQWWLAFTAHSEDKVLTGYLLNRETAKQRLRLSLHGAQYVQARFSDRHLTICDNRGRLLILDLERGTLEKNFRLS